VFTALVDDARRGWFRIAPASDNVRHKQVYWPNTNILANNAVLQERGTAVASSVL
jgi:hypothetical protein